MYLVHEKKGKAGKWEVAWMWLPHFLAADRELHRHIDKAMTKEFKGTMLHGDVYNMYPPSMTPILEDMNKRLIELIVEKYPIPGLKGFLDGYAALQPDEETRDDVAVGG